jgi:hypothetical protein
MIEVLVAAMVGGVALVAGSAAGYFYGSKVATEAAEVAREDLSLARQEDDEWWADVEEILRRKEAEETEETMSFLYAQVTNLATQVDEIRKTIDELADVLDA